MSRLIELSLEHNLGFQKLATPGKNDTRPVFRTTMTTGYTLTNLVLR
jgi:hypothetical protein